MKMSFDRVIAEDSEMQWSNQRRPWIFRRSHELTKIVCAKKIKFLSARERRINTGI
jgi:hypothetical protein